MEYLIPEEWFFGLPQWQLLVLVAIAIAALGKASDVVVEGASGIASGLGVSRSSSVQRSSPGNDQSRVRRFGSGGLVG